MRSSECCSKSTKNPRRDLKQKQQGIIHCKAVRIVEFSVPNVVNRHRTERMHQHAFTRHSNEWVSNFRFPYLFWKPEKESFDTTIFLFVIHIRPKATSALIRYESIIEKMILMMYLLLSIILRMRNRMRASGGAQKGDGSIDCIFSSF